MIKILPFLLLMTCTSDPTSFEIPDTTYVAGDSVPFYMWASPSWDNYDKPSSTANFRMDFAISYQGEESDFDVPATVESRLYASTGTDDLGDLLEAIKSSHLPSGGVWEIGKMLRGIYHVGTLRFDVYEVYYLQQRLSAGLGKRIEDRSWIWKDGRWWRVS